MVQWNQCTPLRYFPADKVDTVVAGSHDDAINVNHEIAPVRFIEDKDHLIS